MASNPPLVEDNSGEDFFDKLVDDDEDVDFKITASSPSNAPILEDGNDSDEAAQAFANLNINDLDIKGEVGLDKISSNSTEGAKDLSSEVEKVGHVSEAGHAEETGNRLVASDSFSFENLLEKAGNESGDNERSSDATVVRKSSDDGLSDQTIVAKNENLFGAPGVKEVDWSAFHADSNQIDNGGFGSYSDFFSEFEGGSSSIALEDTTGNPINNGPRLTAGDNSNESTYVENSNNNFQHNDVYNSTADLSTSTHDLNNVNYWENQYPGWKYDPNTGQWYQIDDVHDKSSSFPADSCDHTSAWDGDTEFSYMQQSAHSVASSVAEVGSIVSVSSWNQGSLVSNVSDTTDQNQVSHVISQNNAVPLDWNQASPYNYPSHMVFDPQYPGWYYDTVASEWRTLESYTASVQSTSQGHDEVNHDGFGSTHASSQHDGQETYKAHDPGQNYSYQGIGSQVEGQKWSGSVSIRNNQSQSMWRPETVANGEANSFYGGNQLIDNQSGKNMYMDASGNQQNSFQQGVTGSYYATTRQSPNGISEASWSQSFSADGNMSHRFNDPATNQYDQKQFYNDYYSINNSSFAQQPSQSAQISYSPATGRSSAGRPMHALVTFGFGGKLIVMKDTNSGGFGAQDLAGGSISVLSLAEGAYNSVDASKHGIDGSNYFQALCRQPAPGPLTGGSVGIKELNKWIDERISNVGSPNMDHRKAEGLRLLLSLLKIACQYYGKLRHPYGTDASLKENDTPESAVAKLFASAAKGNGQQFRQYGAISQCLQQMPSEGQMRAAAAEVQNLLVSGRKKEALQCAQEGQLWGPALVLAAQLGDQFYVETVKQMALRQLRAGSPLRTLCLLIAGQPADVFSVDSPVQSTTATPINMPQHSAQVGANNMLDDWEENLAVIAANRTKDDQLVLIHLGDCLWKDRSDIIAAHICYLVAEASFEPFSDSARLCLVGADHLKHPRTYASPEAIQRTEIYEYSKTLGKSQFVLLQFQPYKLIYAHMLAEVGRTSEALKYCQAVLKSLKTGRTPEAENLRQRASSLEERIKAHQQGGFSTNLAPKEFIGKLLNLFDSTAHRVVGGLPPPVPTAGAATHRNENHHQSMGPRVSASQSTMAMSSLVPSQSMEPISEWATDGNKMSMHTRSVSEPDFGRSPRQADSKNASSAGKTSATGASRFGFGLGSSLLQKTVGLVLKPRSERQAKLGDSNKFYYDEKLKRWVEEGAEPPAEEMALPPPPSTAAFQNGDYNSNGSASEVFTSNGFPDLKSPSTLDNNSGMPPIPPTSNQYSARGRLGVRSRYVDTFNQGSGKATNSFQSPPTVPSNKLATPGMNPKFFVPATVSYNMEQQQQQPVDSQPVDGPTQSSMDNPSTSFSLDSSFRTAAPPNAMSMQRFASTNNIANNTTGESGLFMSHSRRTASWSGSFNGSFSPPQKGELKPLGEVLGMENDGGFRDDLHEVEL